MLEDAEPGDATEASGYGAGSPTPLARSPEMASGEVHRTQLAHERTYLAWWRTGLTGIAAGFGVGRILPEVVGGTNWPYIALGTALTSAGLAAMLYGILHYRELQAALRGGREPRAGEGFILALAVVGIAVGASFSTPTTV